MLADVDISPNPNNFNFWTTESEYIKRTGIRIFFFSKLKESVNPIISRHNNPRIQLFGQNPYESIYGLLESEYISFFAIESEYNYPVRDMDLGPSYVPCIC